jgi:hypothetical protein
MVGSFTRNAFESGMDAISTSSGDLKLVNVRYTYRTACEGDKENTNTMLKIRISGWTGDFVRRGEQSKPNRSLDNGCNWGNSENPKLGLMKVLEFSSYKRAL